MNILVKLITASYKNEGRNKMENKYFEIFIKTCGSEKKAGEILKISQQAISSIRCQRSQNSYTTHP